MNSPGAPHNLIGRLSLASSMGNGLSQSWSHEGAGTRDSLAVCHGAQPAGRVGMPRLLFSVSDSVIHSVSLSAFSHAYRVHQGHHGQRERWITSVVPG